ncbi:MAG: hypothetical protein HQL74_11730 [Magnetococcales bacterium]|nr:hypothetical protein [Magnetococcales bacterium]MBF0420700.1 hypothetical protein [Magnetococcales bacterium]
MSENQEGERGENGERMEAPFFPESTRDLLRQWVRGLLPNIAEPLIREEISRLREEELGRVDPQLLAEEVRTWLEPRIESMARQTIREMVAQALPGIAEPLIKEEIRRICQR